MRSIPEHGFPDPADQPAESWMIAEGEHDGQPLILRYNDWARGLRGHPAYAHQVGVAIPCADQEGVPPLPSHPTTERLLEFEDRMMAEIGRDREAILVAVITTLLMREFVLYTRDPESTKTRLTEIAETTDDLIVQFVIQPDPRWEIFESLLP